MIKSLVFSSLIGIGLLCGPRDSNIDKYQVDANSLDPFVVLVFGDKPERDIAISQVESEWTESSLPKAIEVLRFLRDTEVRSRLIRVMERSSRQKHFETRFDEWSEWSWNRPVAYDSSFVRFKSDFYSYLDFRFADYFSNEHDDPRIRLDEIIWGGVKQDGIPPLRNPKMISVTEAEYLDNDDLVFGIEVDGEARAYPKRILAWHEMFVDTIQGKNLVGVYCTLCGTVILYETTVDGREFNMGTSGFLYRSNKLMYDKETSSMWNTFWGEPVVGPLVNSNIRLPRLAVVNTKWGEWKKRHPETSVLSLETGYQRDYDEGAAYRSYFATDDLMFGVPNVDKRLKNKDEVFTLIEGERLEHSIAISSKFLKKNPLYNFQFNGRSIIVVSDNSGGNRAYESGNVIFESWDKEFALTDQDGNSWKLSEDALLLGDRRLERVAAQTAFWFGWVSANPKTILIK